MHCLLEDDVYVAVGRRFDEKNMDERVLEHIKNSNECMLVYPACDAVSVEEGLAELRRRQRVKAWPQDKDESSNKTKS